MSMMFKLLRPVFFAAALSATLASSQVQAQDQDQGQAQEHGQAAVVVKDYDVFVDPPTAFAFIKLPSGWKFIGKLDVEQMRHLPPGTLTALLPSDEASTRMAAGKKPVLLAKGSTAATIK